MNAASFLFLAFGGLLGSTLGAALFAMRLCPHAAFTIALCGGVGAFLGLVIGATLGRQFIAEGPQKIVQLCLDIFVTTSGFALLLRGLAFHSSVQTLYGIVLMLTPIAYLATSKRGLFATIVSTIVSILFLATAIVNGNMLWLIASAVLGLSAIGFYLHRQRTGDPA